MSERIADTFNRHAAFPKVLQDETRCVVPEPGKCALIPESGACPKIWVARCREDGSWKLYQDRADYMNVGGDIVITHEQMFALRTLLSQDSWF